MPALPGPHRVCVHAHLAFASFAARFKAGARLDDARQLRKRGLLECHCGPMRRREIGMITVAGVVIRGIARGTRLQRTIVRQKTTGDDQPLLGSGAFALHRRLYPAFDHLDGYRTLLTVSHRQWPPGSRIERLAPRRHRLPGWLWTTTASLIRRWQGFQVAHRRGAGHPQHLALAALTQRLAKPRVASQLIITAHPAVWHLRTPRVEYLQTLLLTRVIPHLWRYVACLASLRVACPFLRERQPEGEQRMVVVTDLAHEDTDLAGVDFAPMP